MREFIRNLSKREVVFIVLIIALLAGAGYYAWKISVDKSEKAESINSFAECVAAGNPVMESYPEQCAAGGKTFTNPDQSLQTQNNTPADETENWTEYTSVTGTYKVKLPDGWDMVTIDETENLYGGRGQAGLVYSPGVKASVSEVEGGWDGPSPFALIVPKDTSETIVKEGVKTGEITTTDGLTAERFYYEQLNEPETIGYVMGSKVYNYYFNEAGQNIFFQHVVLPDSEDQHERVEAMIKTFVLL